MNEKNKKCIPNLGQILSHEDPYVDLRIILKWILENYRLTDWIKMK
jgi:hypothetical protein